MVAAILSLFVFLLDFAVVLAAPIPMRHGPLHQAQVGKRSYRTLRPRSGSSGDSGFGNGEELVEVVHGSTVPFNGGGRFLTMDRGSSSKGATSSSTDSFMSTTTVGPPSATDTSTLTVTSSSIGGGDGGGNGAMALETATTPIPTATATSVPPPGSSRPDNDDSQNWVDAHNTARAQYGAGKLTWSSSLASKAQANAQLCTHSHTYGILSYESGTNLM